MEFLQRIFQPIAYQVAQAAVYSEGIVLVVHQPKKLARQAMKKVGIKAPAGKTTVVGVPCRDALAAFGHDPITRRWVSTAPKDKEIKVFLVAGDGTALLTLQFGEEGISVKAESNLHLA